MLKFYKNWTRIFLFPDKVAGGGGSDGNPAANQAGAVGSEGSIPNLFEGVDLNDLEPDVRKQVEAANAKFATLQKEIEDQKKATEKATTDAKAFQSRYDQTQAQLQKLTGGGSNNGTPEEQQREQAIEGYARAIQLKSPGLDPTVARKQGELMFDLLGQHAAQIKQDMGRDMAPFLGTLLSRDAEQAFLQAQQSDVTGTLQNIEVAQVVWKQCQDAVQHGQQVTSEMVTNLAGMEFFKQFQAGKIALPSNIPQPNTNPPMAVPGFPNFGRLTTGGGFPSRPSMTDPNAPKHGALNEDGVKAMKAVTGNWGKAGEKAPINTGK